MDLDLQQADVTLRYLYTVSQKKTPKRTFCADCGELLPILIILSLLHTQMNCSRRRSNNCRLALNMLLHYLAKLDVQMYNYSLTLARIDTSDDNLELEGISVC